MSLRYQINFGILLALVLVLLAGSAVIVFQARQSVAKEVESSIQLAKQLLSLSLHNSPQNSINHSWLHDIASLKETRHLKIQLKQQTGHLLQLGNYPRPLTTGGAPQWFVWLVDKPYPTVNYALSSADHNTVQVMISANALDEISESWQETKAFFTVILLLSSALFIAVNLIFRQVLQAVAAILKNLSEIEAENYQNPLPHFAITEFEKIAQAINHLTSTLHKAQQENNRLTLHSLEIQEEQRQTLAQELHDELGQSISAIKVMAVTGKKNAPYDVKIYQVIIEICEHLFSVVRGMMKTLHPLMLSELGLSASLHDLVTYWQERAPDLKISLVCDSTAIDEIDIKKAIQIFRLVQEAITNTVRHAQAQGLNISLQLNDDNQQVLELLIADNGKGCDSQNLTCGFGLQGMKARVKSLKGSMQIISAKNQGMKIHIYVPVN